ncbi:MAG: undecaprenyl/decaprenyl-phosphate alpha-N-acetylglucosaminyl 1-phosphate transferase [Muribaculaceae bacterium]|nr:undecaprenyl/decaprenyl-phosphate alpha-N-acetylglucosaminyl 1-phosphate transferase [Muribaculaceae bacterium]
MIFWIETIFVAFFISALLTGVLIPQILSIAFRRKLFDNPDARKIHRGVVPRLGGISFLPSVMCAMTLVLGWCLKFDNVHICTILSHEHIVSSLFLMCSLLLLYLVGIADDLIGVRYRAKFVVQIICSVLILISGIHLTNLHDILFINDVPYWLGWILTGFIVVYLLNAINLIDGIDGLASGLSTITLAWYGYIFIMAEQYLYAMIAWATTGSLLTFFYYNVFGKVSKRSKIFMGDTGSLTVGMVIAFLSLALITEPLAPSIEHYDPWIIAYSPLIVPLFDVVRVYLHRKKEGRNPFLPDRSHIHHKLLDLGLSSRKALGIILIISLFFMVVNLLLSPVMNINLILVIDIVVWTIGNVWLTAMIRKKEKREGTTLY